MMRTQDAIADGNGADLFLVLLKDGVPFGRRRHICRVGPGALVPSLAPIKATNGESYGTIVAACPGGALTPCQPASHGEATKTWIAALCANLPDIPEGGIFAIMSLGDEGRLLPGQSAAAARGAVVWIRVEAGSVALLGRQDCSLPQGTIVPLSGRAFVTAGESGAVISSLPSRAVAGSDATDQLHRAVLGHWTDAVIADGIRRTERGEAAASQNVVTVDRMIRTLAQAASPHDDSHIPGPTGSGVAGAMLAAALHVGGDRERLRAALSGTLGAAGPDDLQQAITVAQQAKIPVREVMPRGNWWTGDGPPLVVWHALSGRLFAALPDAKGYQLFDPVTGTTEPITAATQLSRSALSLYPQMPAHQMKAKELAQFAAFGSITDIFKMAGLAASVALAAVLPALATDILVSTVLAHSDTSLLAQVVAGMIVAVLGTAAFSAMKNIVVLRVEGRLNWRMQSALFDRLLRLPTAFFRRYGTGDLADRVLAIEGCRQMVAQGGLVAVFASLSAITNLGLLFVYDIRLAALAVGLALPAMVMVTAAGRLSLKHWRAEANARGRVDNIVYQMVAGIAKLRTAGAETRALAEWSQRFAEMKRHAVSAERSAAWVAVFEGAFTILATAALYGVASLLFGPGDEGALSARSAGSFLAFNAAFGMLIGGLIGGAKALIMLMAAVPLFERARPILTAEARDLTDRADPGRLTGAVEFNQVKFRYHADQPCVLDGLSMTIEPGSFVALVGPSGCGKSTIIRLLLGFELPEAGGIFLDGRPLSTLDLAAVRRQIGTVLQGGKIMAGTVFDNIVGANAAHLDDAWEAAAMAGFDADIKAMPMGMHTMLLDGAGTLSGGQRQRLMIARALVRRPRILIFDEATSALDNVTQAVVTKSLARMGTTRIVIAHRLSTIKDADQINVLAGGRVSQSGTFSELAGRPGLFADLIARQEL